MASKAGSILLLWAIGIIAFGIFVLLVEIREGQPLHPPTEIAASEETGGSALTVLTRGARTTVQTVQHAWGQGRRGEAMHALDASMRTLEVAKHAATQHKSLHKHLKKALKGVKHSRHAIQTGRRSKAKKNLEKAAQALRSALEGPGDRKASPPGRKNAGAFEGALLLDRYGVRIGEVERIKPATGEAVLIQGGWRDLLGFIDIGGQRMTTPLETLVLGKPKTLGSTMVAWPDKTAPEH